MNFDTDHLRGFLCLLLHAQCCAGGKLNEFSVVLTAVQSGWILHKHGRLDELTVHLATVQSGWILYKHGRLDELTVHLAKVKYGRKKQTERTTD